MQMHFSLIRNERHDRLVYDNSSVLQRLATSVHGKAALGILREGNVSTRED